MAQDRLREGLAGIAIRLPAALGDVAFELKTFNDVGSDPADAAGQARAGSPSATSAGVRRRRSASAANAITVPGPRRDHRRGRQPSPGSETHRRSNALARALRDEGSRMGDGVAIMCRNHRYFIEATMACAKLGAVALYLNTAFAGPQLADVMEREEPKALIYDQEFTDLLSERQGRADAPLRRLGGRGERTTRRRVEQLISGAHGEDLEPPVRAGPLHHPHLRHDRHAEGRPAQRARGPERPGGAVLEDPAPLRGDGDDRRAPLPLLGLPALHAQPADRRRRWSCARSSIRRTRCGRSPSTAPGSSRSCR